MNTKNILELFEITKLDYENRIGCLDLESSGEVKSRKIFPIFKDENGDEKIFKPLSKTKPLCTPLFAYSEVFCSYLINRYFDDRAPLYTLAVCKGITDSYPKYYENGTLVSSFLKENQKSVNLLEYFKNEKDEKVDIEKYINYCEYIYDYRAILSSDLFTNNKELSKQLANQILSSILTRNQNFHYENVIIIYEGDKIVYLAPPIDHEFSTMFMYADIKEKREARYNLYSWDLENINGINNKNVEIIAKIHGDLCIDYISRIDKMISDLKKLSFPMDKEGYIGKFSSFEWRVGYLEFKANEAIKAKKFSELIERFEVDTEVFLDEITQMFIDSGEKLKEVITNYLIKNN